MEEDGSCWHEREGKREGECMNMEREVYFFGVLIH